MKSLRLMLKILLLAAAIAVAGCESAPTEVEKYQPETIVSAFLCTGEPVKEVFVEKVAPLDVDYQPQDYGVANAQVVISGGGETLRLVDDPAYRGRYIPPAGISLIPQPTAVYELEIITPQGERITSRTLMPGPVEAHGSVQIGLFDGLGNFNPISNGDTLQRGDANIVWLWQSVDSAGGFQGVLRCLTPRDSLVPLDPDWEPGDTLMDEDKQRSGWIVMREDQRMVTLPWIFFQWEGPHEITLHAISRDYYEHLFALMRRQQGMAVDVKSNIRGGKGIFAGYSRRMITVYLKRA